jgi:Fe-S-cluster containining protein
VKWPVPPKCNDSVLTGKMPCMVADWWHSSQKVPICPFQEQNFLQGHQYVNGCQCYQIREMYCQVVLRR